MVKKIIYITLGVGVFLLLVCFNLSTFKDTTQRLLDLKDLSTLKNYFEIYNTNSTIIYDESIKEIEGTIIDVIDKLDFTLNFLIYFCNFGINILFVTWLTFHETLNGTQTTIKTTPLATLYIRFHTFLDKIKQAVVKALKRLLSLLEKLRRKITLFILIILLANGYLYRFATETIIFIITYLRDMINLETYLIVFTILKFLFLITYPKLKYIPTYIWIPLIIILIFLRTISRANYKLKKNHERLKAFAKDDLTQSTFINGPPGTGKTLLNVSLTLASEENFIEELEKNLLDYELNYKYLNFAKVRANPQDFPEHKDYITYYELLNHRKSLNISNYAIYSPLFEDFSKIFNFEYMRVNKPTEIYPLEEYITISISEFDKEYNSHDNKKEVGEDGAATFLSYAYEQKKNKAFKDLDTFTSLTPSIEELAKCSSRFYDKINQST